MKRPMDITVAALGLVLLSPLLVVVALAVFLRDGHTPFFTQERCGRSTTRFRVVKFRTMTDGHHAVRDYTYDGRVTTVGRVLRRFHIDELPSLANVLKGEMSLVGPRPMPYEVDQELDPGYRNTWEIPGWGLRSSVRPGVTGLAQLYCPKMASRRRKFRYDGLYARRRSFWLDMAIMLRTGELVFDRLARSPLTLTPVALVFLLLAAAFAALSLDEWSNVVDDKSFIPDVRGAIAFGLVGLGWVVLFVAARLLKERKR